MSSTTEVSLRIVDVVDDKGQSTMMPDTNLPSTKNVDIAPWDEPQPSPPAKRTFGFPHKSSFSSFRQGSIGSISNRASRPSESLLSIADSASASTSASMLDNSLFAQAPQLRKSKSSVFRNLIRPQRSRGALRSSSDEAEHPSLLPPPVPSPQSYFLTISSSPPSPSPKHALKKKRRKRNVLETLEVPPTPPPKDDELRLDTNFEDLEGIVDPALWAKSDSPTSPSSGGHFNFSHSRTHSSDHSTLSSHTGLPPLSHSDFHNPFKPQTPPYPPRTSSMATARQINGGFADRKISPKTITPRAVPPPVIIRPLSPKEDADDTKPSWVAPESWAVQPEGEDPEEGYSSEDNSAQPLPENTMASKTSVSMASMTSSNGSMQSRRNIDDSLPASLNPHRNQNRIAKQASNGIPRSLVHPEPHKNYAIRIYRANNTYHVVHASFQVTVAALTPRLNAKLLLGAERETHRLYLKERGRERILAQQERPAEIVQRRLSQAGYDMSDGLELLGGGEGLSFLLKFVYKSQVLGPAEKDIKLDNYEYVDLSSRSLRAIPVDLHKHADSIVSLYLSRNPMLEIPLDFIQDCTTLRELRLSHMAMKKVPHSIKSSITLHRLDLSCNRIADLDDAYLDHIPDLQYLYVQNNRIEKLPWYFPRLRNLTTLNISNNQFATLPEVVCQLSNLKDLDVSFNSISEIPDELGNLRNLERLIIVGNQVSRVPHDFSKLVSLKQFDCRRNQVADLTVICMLPRLERLSVDHNSVHALEVALGPHLTSLDASHNAITQFGLIPGPIGQSPYALTCLDVSYAKLSVLDETVLGQLTSLRSLNLDHNSFRYIPNSLGELKWLETLSCADNSLDTLPDSIGFLQKLETLDAHNNSLTELPASIWQCASLLKINMTSNLLNIWHYPASMSVGVRSSSGDISIVAERKTSTASLTQCSMPPLAYSLEKLYLGENQFTDEVLLPLTIFRELRVLNLSFNEIQDLPTTFFRYLTKLEELYLSGNKLTAIPTEDLPKLTKLSVLFLNGNKLQTLPQELGKIKSLMTLDVGSNILRYNINNWEFDWNWNFNKNLKYLNLSGNKRLQIKADSRLLANHRYSRDLNSISRQSLAGFTDLTQLRVLGLMDVTITTTGSNASVDIPDENDDRRVRTSLSTVMGMGYGIADTLGKNEHLNMLDLVHEFPGRPGESVFAMFGRAQPPKALASGASSNRLAKYLHDRFIEVFMTQLSSLNVQHSEGVPDALRRTFLKLNQDLHDSLFSANRKLSGSSRPSSVSHSHDAFLKRSGASGVVLYFVGKTMYVANAGNALAVVSRGGNAHLLSTKHDPYDREETKRIRKAEGWISPPGLVNDEIDISRSFGFFHLLPVVNARPDVHSLELNDLDEFVIIGNRGLWDYVSYQTAIDIARRERGDPMIAAQKLRDFAISYGAEGSTMIMVISVGDLFKLPDSRSRQPTLDPAVDPLLVAKRLPRRPRDQIIDRDISRLTAEVPAPTGHVTIVFTDIRNSTPLWDVNPGMRSAITMHNKLLRRHLRFCGGYEVKTEGDAFVICFQTAVSALWWCLTIQLALLQEAWPLEMLECEDGKPVYDDQDRLVARGLSVRMGMHSGSPICEVDPITHRMDYFGPMVNRSARIEQSAQGGQIMCSAEVIKELEMSRAMDSEAELDPSDSLYEALEGIRRMGMAVVPVGEVKLKGLETPLTLSTIYPSELEGRKQLQAKPASSNPSGSRVQFSISQMRDLGMLCLRLEALATGRIFRKVEEEPTPERKQSSASIEDAEDAPSKYLYGDPDMLLPSMNDSMSGTDLMLLLDSMAGRIENACRAIMAPRVESPSRDSMKASWFTALAAEGGFDEETLNAILGVLNGI
ncbi:adenylate cyclase [Armillaria fumosa]|nr:adenylate cyclase [Armillaria fumosa]